MPFACQVNSYLKEFKSVVVSCKEAELTLRNYGKTLDVKGYEVVMEDTIFFPEGGGQPCDTGTINGIPVLQVVRRGKEAFHFVETPIEPGTTVTQEINWDRRFYHMQHHTGQHLISCIGLAQSGYATTAWWLGEKQCYIEIDTQTVNQENIDRWEKSVNLCIRDALEVKAELLDPNDIPPEKMRGDEIPEDQDEIRFIRIANIDVNYCCGTHVNNLSQLQFIKLLSFEKGKKNKGILNFAVGLRALELFSISLKREAEITALLSNGPPMHVELIQKLQNSVSTSNKCVQNLLKEIARLESTNLKKMNPPPLYYIIHRKDGEKDFINFFLADFKMENIPVLITVGNDLGEGHVALHGRNDLISVVGPRIAEFMNGKGFCKGTRYQAKVADMSGRYNVGKILTESLT